MSRWSVARPKGSRERGRVGERGLPEQDACMQQWRAAVPVWGVGSDKSNLAGVEGSSCRGEEDKRKARVEAWPTASCACFTPASWLLVT